MKKLLLAGIACLALAGCIETNNNDPKSVVWQSSYHGTFWGYGYPDPREGRKVMLPASLSPMSITNGIQNVPEYKCNSLFYIRHWRQLVKDDLGDEHAVLYAECVDGNQFKIWADLDRGSIRGIWPTSGIPIRPTYPKKYKDS